MANRDEGLHQRIGRSLCGVLVVASTGVIIAGVLSGPFYYWPSAFLALAAPFAGLGGLGYFSEPRAARVSVVRAWGSGVAVVGGYVVTMAMLWGVAR